MTLPKFSPENAQLILEGQKTQTRRPIKEQKIIENFHVREFLRNPPFVIGNKLFLIIQPPSEPSYALKETIEIDKIGIERVSEICHEDFIKEGLKTDDNEPNYLNKWREEWQKHYENTVYSWDKNPWVWVYEFELI